MYRQFKLLQTPVCAALGNALKYSKFFSSKVHSQSTLFSALNSHHDFAKLDNVKIIKSINKEYAAVCALLFRSGLNNISQLPNYLNKRNFHSTPQNLQDAPKQGGSGGQKPDKEDEDKDKISSLLAKAFLWMLTAYMVIAIISLMFPSSSQPEVTVL